VGMQAATITLGPSPTQLPLTVTQPCSPLALALRSDCLCVATAP